MCPCLCLLPLPEHLQGGGVPRPVGGCVTPGMHASLPPRLEYGAAEQQRESSLKFQTRCIATYPDGSGYALGSVEGRVAMELLDLSPQAQAGKYAFKVGVGGPLVVCVCGGGGMLLAASGRRWRLQQTASINLWPSACRMLASPCIMKKCAGGPDGACSLPPTHAVPSTSGGGQGGGGVPCALH